MAALPEINISTTLVGNYLGDSSRNIGILCGNTGINQWSRKKPIRIQNPVSSTWYKASDNRFGLSLPLTILGDETGGYNYIWGYIRPNDANGYRLGDFRGYDNSMGPAMVMNLYPSGTVKYLLSSNILFQYDRSTNPIFCIELDEFDIDFYQYYFGIRLRKGILSTDPTIWVTLATNMSDVISAIVIDLGNSPFNGSPGTYYWEAFICESIVPQTDSLNVAQSSYQILMFPEGNFQTWGNRVQSGSFILNTAPVIDAVINYVELELSAYQQTDWEPDTDSLGNPISQIVDTSYATWEFELSSNAGQPIPIVDIELIIDPLLAGTGPIILDMTGWTIETSLPANGDPIVFNSGRVNSWADPAQLFNTEPPTIVNFTIQHKGVAVQSGYIMLQGPNY